MYKLVSFVFITVTTFSCVQKESPEILGEIEAIENGLIYPVIPQGQEPETFNILERMKYHKVPGVSIAVVIEGELRWAKAYGIANTEQGNDVTTSTLFQAGSISKPLAALAALKLADEDRLDLDEDVNTYLESWQIPENRFTSEEKVTIRRLLTHNAGMTVHGFPGYTQSDTFPSIDDVLNGKGNTPPIVVDTFPGAIWRYSGGGYTVMEKAVEDVSGQPLEHYIKDQILVPLGMDNSTYSQPLAEEFRGNASAAYTSDGEIIEGWYHNYPEQAAAGLWTTPTDLAIYCMAIQDIYTTKKDGVLTAEMVGEMLSKHQNDWGLGPSLGLEGDSLIFRHGGKNAGFTNEMIAFAKLGHAVIIMTSADNGGRLIGEILRGISKYYDWGIRQPREVELIDVAVESLITFTGKYKLDFEVPDIGDYFVDAKIEGDILVVYDDNSGDRHELTPVGEMKFIDLERGDEVLFELSDESGELEILWEGQYRFEKVEE